MAAAPTRPFQPARPDPRRNALVALGVTATAVGMLGAAYAAVPLYRLFCQATGYAGATNIAAAAPATVGDRLVTVVFDANTARGMPWQFYPAQRQITLHVGEEGLAFYVASNPTDRVIRGSASFNVAPAKVGKYFSKIQCFCFNEQVLEPGQTADLGVSFFVDPALVRDHNLDDVDTIILSYTFFEVPLQQADRAGATAAQPPPAGTIR